MVWRRRLLLWSWEGDEGIVGNQAAEGVVGDEGRVVGEGQLGNWACAVAGIQPALDGDPVKCVARGEYNRVGHYFQRNRTLEIVWELCGHSQNQIKTSHSQTESERQTQKERERGL